MMKSRKIWLGAKSIMALQPIQSKSEESLPYSLSSLGGFYRSEKRVIILSSIIT